MRTDITHDGKTETKPSGQWRTIVKVFLHKDFNFPNNDIAIAVMDQMWVFNKNVSSVRMATSSSDYVEHQCMSAGYGQLGFNLGDRMSPIMLTAEIETISRWRCTLLWEMNMDEFVCSSSAVSDVSRGDSGGPLVCRRTGDPEERDDEGVLVGIVSGKNVDATTLYTRVSAFRTWIANDYKDGGGADRTLNCNAGDTLHMSLNVVWSIILFVY
ncbi:hypothetical protein PYW07_008848 [Mythimna separata]|uniref:Peptidase S1 domain-containing protein n=1 Tax=Mythimna separata TaxID=271217 RepID=A0AAD7YAK5_MYTSE|nr:hypothetical protein PYW07_008848 [Mythimna separata]